jgi:hypothetical protein
MVGNLQMPRLQSPILAQGTCGLLSRMICSGKGKFSKGEDGKEDIKWEDKGGSE